MFNGRSLDEVCSATDGPCQINQTKQRSNVLCDQLLAINLLTCLFQGKAKAVRNRAKVSQSLEKLQHAQRQEAAQQRREDKAKAAKERMLAETDPDKQRKMEVMSFSQ